MTPTAAEVIDPTCQLQDAPEFWRFTPCNGNKVPINPGTGRPANDWQLNPYTLTDIATLNGNAPAIGLMTGPASLTLCVDFDGPAAIKRSSITSTGVLMICRQRWRGHRAGPIGISVPTWSLRTGWTS